MNKYIAKIHTNNDKDQHKKNVVFGVSLSGNGVLSPEQVEACLKKLANYKHVFIMLHGDKKQSDTWLEKNKQCLETEIHKKKFTVVSWHELQSNNEYSSFYNGEFLKYYESSKTADTNFYEAIESTVNEFIARNVERRNCRNEVFKFVLEEMAFLMKFAIDAVSGLEPHCFIYPSAPLDAFEESKRVFLTGDKVGLMQWFKIDINMDRNNECKEDIQQLLFSQKQYNRYAEELNGQLYQYNSLLQIYINYQAKMPELLKKEMLSNLKKLREVLDIKLDVIKSDNSHDHIICISNDDKKDYENNVKNDLTFEEKSGGISLLC